MQLSYHLYSVRDRNTGDVYRVDLRRFFSGYAGWRNSAFKNGFSHGGESVFLLPYVGNVYMFVQAKDNEIIKKIERSTISVSEIRDVLNENDSVGFASFVCIGEDFIAFGSTVLAPRVKAFAAHVNALFHKLEIDLSFDIDALTYTLPKQEVQSLSHVGKFSVCVKSGNRLFDAVKASFGGGDREDFDIGSIEITVRPLKARGDNGKALKAALNNVGDQGLESFDVRAKIDAADKMTDVFIVGAGGVRDPIDTSDMATIADQIVNAASSNKILGERLRELRKDNDRAVSVDPADLDLGWPPARAAALGSDGTSA